MTDKREQQLLLYIYELRLALTSTPVLLTSESSETLKHGNHEPGA